MQSSTESITLSSLYVRAEVASHPQFRSKLGSRDSGFVQHDVTISFAGDKYPVNNASKACFFFRRDVSIHGKQTSGLWFVVLLLPVAAFAFREQQEVTVRGLPLYDFCSENTLEDCKDYL